MVGTSLPGGKPHYFFFLCLSDLCIWSFLLECLWLKGHFSPKSLLLECDFFGVVAAVYFLACLLWHGLCANSLESWLAGVSESLLHV